MVPIVSSLIKKYNEIGLSASEIREHLKIDAYEFKFFVPNMKDIRSEIEKYNASPLSEQILCHIAQVNAEIKINSIQWAKQIERFNLLTKHRIDALQALGASEEEINQTTILIGQKVQEQFFVFSNIAKNLARALRDLNEIKMTVEEKEIAEQKAEEIVINFIEMSREKETNDGNQ